MAVPLSAAAIEAIHDQGIAVAFPGIEPVQEGTCLQLNLLLSAEQQPYQECFGSELYPTFAEKAAYLFFHLTTSHIFDNGNKRTAVLCLDAFMVLNGFLLSLSNEDVLALAQRVASAGERKERPQQVLDNLREVIAANVVELAALQHSHPDRFRSLQQQQQELRDWDLNRVGFPLKQVVASR